MRNIPIPVDTSRLAITCVKAPQPRIRDRQTGEIKVDKNGQTVYEITTSTEDAFGRIELVKIAVAGEPPIGVGQRIFPVNLVGYVWEIAGRWGISYRADSIISAETAQVGAKSRD